MAGYVAQRNEALGDSWDDVLRTVVDRSSPELWGDILSVPLERAAAEADEDLVDRLLQAGANPKGLILSPWRSQRTLVNAAVDGGSARVLSALLLKGDKAGINTPACLGGPTPLQRAVQEGKEDVARVSG